MGKQKYIKPALSLDEQVEFLSRQGLIINRSDKAQHILSAVGYYRFSGYLLPFKLAHQDESSPREFKAGATFDKVWQLYQFDRELRLLVIDAIEKIEVAFRAAIANVTSTKLNPFWYVERSHYKDTRHYLFLMSQIEKIIRDKQEVFINHYLDKYKNPDCPPIWMMIETLSFGACSKLFSNIKNVGLKKDICQVFNKPPTIIDSWMRTLTYVRNLCAHYARLWNRWLVNPPLIPKNEPFRAQIYAKQNYRFYLVAYIIHQLTKEIAPKSPWRNKLYKLFEKYDDFVSPSMGFAKDWRTDTFWKL